MHRLRFIPGLIFGLFFASIGYLILAETGLPMWQNWQRMQDWRPTHARLLSVAAADNETRASYRYDFAGGSYQGAGTGVSEFKDNIGSYHQDMQAYLRRVLGNDEPLPIWVNPANPAEAVIDRNMRWGLFALISAFCSVFMFIGGAIVFASVRSSNTPVTRRPASLSTLRKTWQQAQRDGTTRLEFVEFSRQHYAQTEKSISNGTAQVKRRDWRSREGWERAEIRSDAAQGALFYWSFAILWNAISAPVIFYLPEELRDGNYPALLGLLFPAAGLFLLYKAIALSLEYRRFGKVLYRMDPWPGAIGGHVGGHILVKQLDYRRAIDASDLTIKLQCVHSYVSGSGDNRSRRESIEWAEQGRPKIDNALEGVNLSFRFDVPGNLPEADVDQGDACHFWRLGVGAEIPGVDLQRSFNIPVFATGEASRNVGHDLSAQAAAARKQESDAARIAIASGRFDIEGLSRAMRFDQQGNRIRLWFPMFRNKVLTLVAAIFAGGFGFASYSMAGMASAGGLFGIFILIFSIPFLLVALFATIASIYLLFNNLVVDIDPTEVTVLRRLLFIPVFRRRLQRGEISQLGIKRSGSSGQGVDKIEHFKIWAADKQGRKLTLAEDIDGEDVATHFRDYLAQRVGGEVR